MNFFNNLFNVPYEVFSKYIEKNNLKAIPGPYCHSINYIDENNVIKAYKETSSWGADTIYQIDDVTYQNLEIVNLIVNIFNKK